MPQRSRAINGLTVTRCDFKTVDMEVKDEKELVLLARIGFGFHLEK